MKVSDASGVAATLNIAIGRGGYGVERQSSPLAVQNGTLPPGASLWTSASDLVGGADQILPACQVATWAKVDNDGTHVTIYVLIAPRYKSVSPFGGYSGSVSLDDPRAVDANVPLSVHVEYYDVSDPVAWALLAAFGGFIWAWFIHRHLANDINPQPFWSSLVFRIASANTSRSPPWRERRHRRGTNPARHRIYTPAPNRGAAEQSSTAGRSSAADLAEDSHRRGGAGAIAGVGG